MTTEEVVLGCIIGGAPLIWALLMLYDSIKSRREIKRLIPEEKKPERCCCRCCCDRPICDSPKTIDHKHP